MSADPFQLGSVYSFTTKAPGSLKLSYTNLLCLSKLRYTEASKSFKIAAMWASIYPYLSKDGTSTIQNNPAAYDYYVFQSGLDTKIAIATPWVNINSIQLISSISMNINMYSLNNLTDAENVIRILKAAGYRNFTTNIITPPTQ